MRWKCKAAYDGTGFYGWQSQAGGNTVQDFIERRLERIFQRKIRIHGSGRTDSGVHAKGQVFHFDGDWPHPKSHLLRALRSGFPDSIRIYSLQPAPDSFHARYSAKGKLYTYRLYEGFASPFETRFCWSLGNRRLDIGAMREAAATLIGSHDFTAFAAERGDGSRENPVKNLRKLHIAKTGPRIRIATEAGGYLYKMVRSLAGTLVDAGAGKLSPDDVARILSERRRTALVVTAPARGLCLERVYY